MLEIMRHLEVEAVSIPELGKSPGPHTESTRNQLPVAETGC
jgi:hypothetical protein